MSSVFNYDLAGFSVGYFTCGIMDLKPTKCRITKRDGRNVSGQSRL